MSIRYYAGDKLTGLSSDSKPTNIADGATFYELDTAREFLKADGEWGLLSGASTALGSWESKSESQVYQASTDGFVICYVTFTTAGYGYVTGYTDGSNPPTTIKGAASVNSNAVVNRNSFCMPVKKNDYWEVIRTQSYGTVTAAIYWIPLGS
jgi:hypothetical protein